MPPPPAPAPVAKAAPRVTSTMAAPVSAKTAAASSAEVKALRAEVSTLKERVEVLENENIQLRAENDNMRRNGVVVAGAAPAAAAAVAVAAPPPSSPGDAPYTSTPSRRGSDAKDLLRKRLSVHGGAAASAAKAATDEANDLDMTSEHPDWDKKYSDQHKRVYWRHKVCTRSVQTFISIR
jgi:hypothetical protein